MNEQQKLQASIEKDLKEQENLQKQQNMTLTRSNS